MAETGTFKMIYGQIPPLTSKYDLDVRGRETGVTCYTSSYDGAHLWKFLSKSLYTSQNYGSDRKLPTQAQTDRQTNSATALKRQNSAKLHVRVMVLG